MVDRSLHHVEFETVGLKLGSENLLGGVVHSGRQEMVWFETKGRIDIYSEIKNGIYKWKRGRAKEESRSKTRPRHKRRQRQCVKWRQERQRECVCMCVCEGKKKQKVRKRKKKRKREKRMGRRTSLFGRL